MVRQHHYLKTLPVYFQLVESGRKTFEVRLDDRNYQVGDILHLREFISPDKYTGKEIVKEVTYILDHPEFCKDKYIIMALGNFEE